MIKAVLGVATAFLAMAGMAGMASGPAGTGPSRSIRLQADGTSSTPGAFSLPQLGSAGIRCGRNWTAQPFFDLRGSVATEAVSIQAAGIVRRNFVRIERQRHGRSLTEQEFSSALRVALPLGRYRTVTFRVRQDDEAREIDATVTAVVVAGTFAVRGVPGRLGACYVKLWSVRMHVSPF